MAVKELSSLILVTVVGNALAVVFIAIALGTNDWFHGTASNDQLEVDIKYGIFKGKKTIKVLNSVNSREADLYLTCLRSNNVCMLSCGTDKDKRKTDIKNVFNNGLVDSTLCFPGEARDINPALPKAGGDAEKKFINYGLLICTLIFLSIGIMFIVLGGGLALYNIYYYPIQPILSDNGLYIWNAVSAISVFIAMIFWLVVHLTILTKNAAVSETLGYDNNRFATDQAVLGFSFWMQLPAIVMNVANLVVLKVRSWKIAKMKENALRVMNIPEENGDILLF